jgi:periplasmic protein TonB
MFESVTPETFERPSRKVWYESLPVSLGFHCAVGAALVLATTWDVKFPQQTPRLAMMYTLDEPPTPPPPPPPPPPIAKPTPVASTQPVATHMEELAPTVIPDVIPQVLPEPAMVAAVTMEAAGGVEGGVEGGVAGGVADGMQGGEIGGTVGSIVTTPAPPPDTVIIKRDAPLPTAPMSMVYPKYPEEARLNGWEDAVVVRYIIGKDGRVRDVIVLDKPDRDLFEKPTVKAIRNWRFRPLKKDGVAQEVVHELTIIFKLEA